MAGDDASCDLEDVDITSVLHLTGFFSRSTFVIWSIHAFLVEKKFSSNCAVIVNCLESKLILLFIHFVCVSSFDLCQ